MNSPRDVERAFEPYKFMLGVLIKAHLGGADHDYMGVVIDLDEDGRAFTSFIRQASARYTRNIAGDTILAGLKDGVYVALVPREILLALLFRFDAKSTVEALRAEPPAAQMHVVWKRGGEVLSLLLEVGKPAAAPMMLPFVRGGSA